MRGGKKRKDELDTKEALNLCERIASLGVEGVSLMGGEPLIRRDWQEIASKLISKGIKVGIVTNGYLFDEKIAKLCEKIGIYQVCLSIDGASPEIHDRIRNVQGSYLKAIKALKILNSTAIPDRTIITSVNKINLGELEKLRDILLKEANGFTWIINYTSEGGRISEEVCIDESQYLKLAQFIEESRKVYLNKLNISGTHSLGYFSKKFKNIHAFKWEGCVAGIKTLGIRSNGDVTGCLILPDEFIEGNVRKRDIVDLWYDPNSFSFNRMFDKRKLRGECRNCRYSEICRAGCTNIAYHKKGTIYEFPWCLYKIEKRENFL